jgi:hypothetical protein
MAVDIVYREIKPGGQPLVYAYLAVMLWFMGRALQAASHLDDEIRSELRGLPEGFTFALGALPRGPYLIAGKSGAEAWRYLGGDIERQPVDLKLSFKHLAAGLLAFTFRESTPTAVARDRLELDGEAGHACAVIRMLDIVEVYLLPKFIARLAVKRYPHWTFKRKWWNRVCIYWRTVIGY